MLNSIHTMWKLFIPAFLVFSFSYCKSVQYSHPSEFPGAKISFGNGGGFAGTYKEYLLCENGQLFYRTSEKASFNELEKLEQTESKQCFSNFSQLGLKNLEINDPGNLYYFLKFEEKEEQHQLIWGGIHSNEKSPAKLFYQNLMHLVKDKNPIK